ncbi:energy-coupling factor ABC transporter substrate-binding protein [Acetivibrio mesophilus]|jgi:cobalt/nickel transport protein|uniref:Cobalt transport protein CbiN n=1 Tax=Acetivibrio mesophilus TaxID=2487273 RepID=A0A4Q0I8Y0_9FIRM|nr:energy-coupling factor ABC transporter substrate-binding protein [Acetivibrio mesophilus]RXE60487.1 energy-coupling factor ABC transporter substrate-binding protein [Acetivibrio mesophilus]
MQTEAIRQTKKNNLSVNLLLILIVIALAIIPLFIAKDAEFGGADGQAEEAIAEINADYEPWFSPIFEPKSGEIESLLFALQAAIGAGIIGYGLGYLKGRRKEEDEKSA